MHHQFDTFLYIAANAFVLNLPLGMWRSTVRKMSLSWFLALFMSLPLIVSSRTHIGLDTVYIPPIIIVAMIAQRVGGQIIKKIKLDSKEGFISS